jgi:arylsulfatase A-like enzyme
VNRILFLSVVLLAGWVFGATERPNVVILVADDEGWGDIGWNNPEVKTPNLDKLAAEGVKLEHFYANPICSVTRAALMTGMHTLRTGVENFNGLDLKYQTLPQALHDAGYQTWMCGKWHLGGAKENSHPEPEYLPTNRGFDHYYGLLGGAVDYNTHMKPKTQELDWWRNGQAVTEEGYSTDLLANEAIGLIQKRDKERPFLLYLAFNAIHGPISVPPGDATGGKTRGRPALLAAMGGLDAAVGRVMAELEKEGLKKNTLVIFFSDNGGDITKGSTNLNLREGKGTVFEGGIRVPAAMNWPGVLAPGQRSEQFLCVADLFPTILDVTGVKMASPPSFDGKDIWPALKEGRTTEHPIFFMGNKEIAVFRPPWKLITSRQGQGASPMLFDVVSDPSEKNDLSSQHPEIVQELTQAFQEYVKDIPQKARRGSGGGGGGGKKRPPSQQN